MRSLVFFLLAAAASAEPGLVGFHVEPLAVLSAEQKSDLRVAGDHGVVVAAIVERGPAAKAGLEIGDRLVRFASFDVPDLLSGNEEARHLWRVAIRMMMAHPRAGEPIDVVVERGGAQRTLALTPVTAAGMHELQADETARDLPPLAEAGSPEPLRLDFQGDAPLYPYEGRWRVVKDPDGGAVLRQDRMILPWAVLLVAGKGRAYADAKASVRFMPVSGVSDASGGIVFRAQDPLNYYLVRPNALEDNFRLYVVRDGVRKELASVQVTPPKPNEWHVIEVEFKGDTFRATLDGQSLLEARDATFARGWCGLWTKADSVSLFDDLNVLPSR